MTLALAAASATMYGVDDFCDSPCYTDYDPWEHADMIKARIVSNMTLPDNIVAAYSHQMHTIFFRADLHEDVERCAIAHELVHLENRDKGKSAKEEARADRISTLRLIRPSRLIDLCPDTHDIAECARELGVTETVMRHYARMARNGTLPR